ncbi:MAG: helix-turn-helix transcriptional regulator [Caulobacter sp.]|nr:helix-turn-helix transcriptional regulator [Caulobacter sp.]
MSKLEEQFGEMLRYHRKRAGLSQAQLAEKIDRQPNAVQRLESGEAAPTFDTLERLATALNVDVRELFGTGEYAARSDREDPLAAIFKLLVGLKDRDLQNLHELIVAALKLRK